LINRAVALFLSVPKGSDPVAGFFLRTRFEGTNQPFWWRRLAAGDHRQGEYARRGTVETSDAIEGVLRTFASRFRNIRTRQKSQSWCPAILAPASDWRGSGDRAWHALPGSRSRDFQNVTTLARPYGTIVGTSYSRRPL